MVSRNTLAFIDCLLGVTIETIRPGNGINRPKKGDIVRLHYVGKVMKGEVFDDSWKKNKPFDTQIGVGQVIRGWDEGIVQLSLGEKAKLVISPDYGYGQYGIKGIIPENATLEFEVELIAINPKD